MRYAAKHSNPIGSKAIEAGSGVVLSVPEPDVDSVRVTRLRRPLPVSVPLYQTNAPVPPLTFRTCVKDTAVGGDVRSLEPKIAE